MSVQVNSTNEEETSNLFANHITFDNGYMKCAHKRQRKTIMVDNHIKDTCDRTYIDIPEVYDSLTKFDVKYALGKKTHTKFSFIHYSGL